MLFRSLMHRLTAVAFLLALPLAAGMDTYTIDPVHSEIGFRIRHLVSKTSGHYTRFKGTIRIDPQAIPKSSVDVAIEAASISTDSDARDKHLRSDDFFAVEKYPAITFKSVAVKEVAKGKIEVYGDLTMHGVTRRITIPMSILGTMKDPQGKVHAGFEGALTLDRNAFGITSFPGMLGDQVEVTLNVEALKD
nr:YceI family protein [uncultured Holophaga sp.]